MNVLVVVFIETLFSVTDTTDAEKSELFDFSFKGVIVTLPKSLDIM